MLGTLHGQTQAVEVISLTDDGWARISAWNHEAGVRIEGYVPRQVLITVSPSPTYGVVIRKADQTLTVYREGVKLGSVPVSTGLPTAAKPIRETAAGVFLTEAHMLPFTDGGYTYQYPVRFDGGNLLHQLGYRPDGQSVPDFSDQTPQLGSRASHGCVRVPNQPGEGGINAYWLWTHLPRGTRVIILDDDWKPSDGSAAADDAGVLPERMAQEEQTTFVDSLFEGLLAEDEDELLFAPDPGREQTEERILLTFGGDAVIGCRESWWRREDALPAFLSREGMAYPFSGLQEVFASDDMTLVNLECVLKANRDGERTDKQYRFRGLPSYAAVLKEGSVEQVNIANNHYIDYEAAGKKATRDALNAAEIPFSGYGYTYVWTYRGHRIGFAGCRETIFLRDEEIIARETASLRQAGCEVVIYSCHWGQEYSPAHNDTQQRMAQAAADAGVDLVIGNHPHVVQGAADVDGTAVVWSLGNLMFGGTIELTTFDAALAQAELCFDHDGYAGLSLRYLPIQTSGRANEGVNDYRPVLASGEDRARIMQLIREDSQGIQVDGDMWFPARER